MNRCTYLHAYTPIYRLQIPGVSPNSRRDSRGQPGNKCRGHLSGCALVRHSSVSPGGGIGTKETEREGDDIPGISLKANMPGM